MHPAPSVIIFTALSGLGFGLMAFLGIGLPPVSGWVAFWYYVLAYALAGGGLLASVGHLGNPKNAVYAFSQWRTSWLSREGVSSIATLAVVGLYAIGLIFLDQRWTVLGWIGSAMALVTVFTTSKIYNQLKTVPRWNMALTPVLFQAYAIAGGALLAGQITLAAWLLLALTGLQLLAWIVGDGAFRRAGSTKETATGLGFIGKVRQLESAHSSPNYLMKEMVHVVGRRHSAKLRAIATLFLGPVPVALLVLLPFSHVIAVLAVAAHMIGLFAARWLFFAEAEHVVGLYYGKR